MKRILLIFLILSLCISLAACGGTGNETHDYILTLLEKGEYDMAIHVIEGLRDGKAAAPREDPQPAPQSGDRSAAQSGNQEFVIQAEHNGSDWQFFMELVNNTSDTLTMQAVVLTEFTDDKPRGSYGFEGEDLNTLPFGKLVLEPGESIAWNDMRPLDVTFNRMEYRHIFQNPQGQDIHIVYLFEMDGGQAVPQQPSGDWTFPCVLENTSDAPWELTSMDITHFMNEDPMGTTIFEGPDLERVGMGGLTLQPGQQYSYMDGHPVVSDWNTAEYRFHFKDSKGQTHTLTFRFEDLQAQSQSTDYSQDPGQDLKTLRHDAAFEEEVSEGVYWVPAVTLGGSRYSNAEIHSMLSAPPEEKQQKISTLYEALQLYQVGNFTGSDDNVRLSEGGIHWEHHKPGYHAVRTNTGCCATDSNWLRYILDGDYDEVGYIATSQRDGSGHIYNYIFSDGWYYIIDLTHYHATGPLVTAPESGDRNDYRHSDYILGNIHKVRDIQNYVDYVQREFGDPPALMFQYTAENCLAVDSNNHQVIYEDTGMDFVKLIFDNPSDNMEFIWSCAPQKLPDWQ